MSIGNLFDLPSAIFVLVPVFGAFIASGFTQCGFKLANGIVLQVGLVGTLIGLVVMLGNLADPDAIGPGLSIASLTILYSLAISAVFTLVSLNFTPELPDFHPSYNTLAVILWIVINLWAIIPGSGLSAFVNIPSLVFLALSILVIATVSKFNAKDSLVLCAKYLPYAGLIGFFIGIILMLQNLSEPRLIGPAVAISFLTLFYANWISVAIKLAFPKIGQQYESSCWQYLGFTILCLALILSMLSASLIV